MPQKHKKVNRTFPFTKPQASEVICHQYESSQPSLIIEGTRNQLITHRELVRTIFSSSTPLVTAHISLERALKSFSWLQKNTLNRIKSYFFRAIFYGYYILKHILQIPATVHHLDYTKSQNYYSDN